VSPLRELNQDSVQENTLQKRREKEIQRLSQKLNNQNLRSLSVTSCNKRTEYFPEENIIIKGFCNVAEMIQIFILMMRIQRK
jgi:sialic acid synthase SpsE